ncbi:MAG: hypothetical protein ACOZIN_03410 [Myxococcota bacterium]
MNETSFSETEAHRELERLQAEVSSRASVVHFAHAGVSMIVALLVAGAAAKLFWDLPLRALVLAFFPSALSLGLAAYSVLHYRRGKRELEGELRRYQMMLTLRRTLRLDDPAALLPR